MPTPEAQTTAAARLVEPAECLLLVIDLQEKFVPYLRRAARVLSGTGLLLDAAHALGAPVLVTEHNPRAIGPTVPEVARHLRGDPVMAKMIFSCCGDEGVLAAIRGHEAVRTLVLAGCEAHICVMQTALDALRLGYAVHVAADAVSSRMALDYRVGLERMRDAGAVVASAEMTAYELLRRADGPGFKALLPAFKGWVGRVNE